MRRLALCVVVVLAGLLSRPAWADTTIATANLTSLGYCQLTSLGSAVGLSSCSGGIPRTAAVIIAVPETQAVRWRDDGTAPTSSVGMPLGAGGALIYQADITAIKFIEQTSGAKLNVMFYQYK